MTPREGGVAFAGTAVTNGVVCNRNTPSGETRMLWLLLRLATVLLAMGAAGDVLITVLAVGGIDHVAAALAGPLAMQVRTNFLYAGLMLAGSLLCWLATGVLYLLYRLEARLRDPYDDHPKMAPNQVRHRH
jgi:hypothetical protein